MDKGGIMTISTRENGTLIDQTWFNSIKTDVDALGAVDLDLICDSGNTTFAVALNTEALTITGGSGVSIVGADASTQIQVDVDHGGISGLSDDDHTQYLLRSDTYTDYSESTFSAANNQAGVTNVTGLVFANATYRASFIKLVIEIDADTDLFEVFDIRVVQRSADWDLFYTSNGDDAGIEFSITSAGQLQYTSGNEAGYSSSVFTWEATAIKKQV